MAGKTQLKHTTNSLKDGGLQEIDFKNDKRYEGSTEHKHKKQTERRLTHSKIK